MKTLPRYSPPRPFRAPNKKPRSRHEAASELVRVEYERDRLERDLANINSRRDQVERELARVELRARRLKQALG